MKVIGTLLGAGGLTLLAACGSGHVSPHPSPSLDAKEKAALTRVETRAQVCEPLFKLSHPLISTKTQVIPCFAKLAPKSERTAFGKFAFSKFLSDRAERKKNRPAWYNQLAVWVSGHAGS